MNESHSNMSMLPVCGNCGLAVCLAGISCFTQGLFRNFDEAFLPLMKPHIERMVKDMSRDTHDSNQRCAAELIAGLIRGSKHWNYDMVVTLTMSSLNLFLSKH